MTAARTFFRLRFALIDTFRGSVDEIFGGYFVLQRLKLRQFRGNLNKFIEQNPQAMAYFNMRESKLKFKFPQPGPIEGVKSRSKALMKMAHCDFTYPGGQFA